MMTINIPFFEILLLVKKEFESPSNSMVGSSAEEITLEIMNMAKDIK